MKSELFLTFYIYHEKKINEGKAKFTAFDRAKERIRDQIKYYDDDDIEEIEEKKAKPDTYFSLTLLEEAFKI